MKKINFYPMLVALLITFSPVHLFANEKESPVATPAPEAARAEVLINRLEEIKNMDMSTLSRAEKERIAK
ncbi:MAG: hypothetical protein U5K79_13000 [Cyclobacteriaceae bacterium]|nr:hypothetical protein [Cyclobacteriaceae bacterium]